MRGSRIAKQIITEQRREAKRKQIALQLREAMRRRRGESNGERTESSAYGLETASREARNIEKGPEG